MTSKHTEYQEREYGSDYSVRENEKQQYDVKLACCALQ
jgi:hypothetical protein